jgi:hypothetical protein
MDFGPPINNYIEKMVRERCEESDHVCPFWVNEDVLEVLKKADKLDDGKRAEIYYFQCHSPVFIYRPHTGECVVECRKNALHLGNYYGDECKYQNLKVATEIIQEHFSGKMTNEGKL